MKVRDVMTAAVVTAEPGTSFKETAERMLDFGVTGLPVVGTDGRLRGIVTEADLISKEAFGVTHRRSLGVVLDALTGRSRWTAKADGLTAADVMTERVITARPDEDITIAARRMLEAGVKRLPVVEDDRVVGMVSRHDLLRLFHRPDRAVQEEIEARLGSPLYAPDRHAVTCHVEEGVVTLEGTVDFAGEVPMVEALARNVTGVVHVVNRVGYNHPDPSGPSTIQTEGPWT